MQDLSSCRIYAEFLLNFYRVPSNVLQETARLFKDHEVATMCVCRIPAGCFFLTRFQTRVNVLSIISICVSFIP